MPFYKPRGLPHWDPEDAAIFLTWRLHDSLPPLPPEWAGLPTGKQFAAVDQILDHSLTGPHYLKNPAIAKCVADAIAYGANGLRLYELCAWVIMSNHVHLLIVPRAPLARITRSIKNFSAREANRILGRSGEPFWQKECFDRWVRCREEFDKIVHYIEHNPVSAGLVEHPEQWPWSSLAKVGQEADGTRVEEVLNA
jgi:REP element-mobilizing transposase RayT